MHFRSLDLVGVTIDTDKAGAAIAGQIAHRPTYAASHIEHFHPGFQGKPVGKKVLMPEQRRLEALALTPGGKMKRLTPAEFVEIGHQVVIVIDERPITLFSTLRASIEDFGVFMDHGFYFIRREACEGTRD